VLVYVHTNISSENKPNFAWMRKMYSIFNRKYKKNLKMLYIVHPSVWVKMTFKLFKPFISSKFWRKLVYIDQAAELFNYFPKDQITLPSYVLNRNSPQKKESQPIFGVALEEVIKRPENNGLEIPLVMDKAIRYLLEKALDVEGIFRLSGGNSQIKELKKSFDNGEEVDLSDVEDPHVVVGLLKMYLRELPIPLFPFNLYSSLMETQKLGDIDAKISHLRSIVSSLPHAHNAAVKHLFCFLTKVARKSDVNRMTAPNLAIVIAPNVIRDANETMASAVADANALNSVVALLITHAQPILM
jgi:hypothetical protein